MDAAATTAGWLSFVVTAIGLGSLITQASAIQERLDPYHSSRTAEHLGPWIWRQPKKTYYRLAQPTPVGPVIHAKLIDGFCGLNVIGVSRLPLENTGKASWTAVLAIFHEHAPLPPRKSHSTNYNVGAKSDAGGIEIVEKAITRPLDVETGSSFRQKRTWPSLQTVPLKLHSSTTCITISRTTLITMLALCNGRTIFRYSNASGHRASYGSYCGHFYIEWPLGAPAVVHFHPHESHSTSTDVYPSLFRVRVDKCVQIMAGIITSGDGISFQCAFPGRKSPGIWTLEYLRKGFPGAHGSRHLYNLMGGKVYDVDFLMARRLDTDAPHGALKLRLPSTEKGTLLSMFVAAEEQELLEYSMDCLPWSSLSWSIHRGLRDILVAYAKPTMDKFRRSLASRLRAFISEQPHQLITNGWSADFVQGAMAEVAVNSILAGSGNSGDSVRVVTDVASLLSARDLTELDETEFWRHERHQLNEEAWLSTGAVVALTKCFVLEWSIEFDYQMYHDLPPELLFY